MEKSSGDHLNYQSSGVVPPEWQFSNPSMGILPGSPIGSSPFPSVSMTESFTSGLWNQHHATNPQNLGLCQNSASSDLGWNPSEPVPKVPLFLQATPGDLPPSLSHIPADSAFIERAARFSCFNGGNLHGLVNPFVPSGSNSPYLSASKGLSGVQKSEVNVAESSKEVSMSSDHRSHSGSPMKNNREKGSLQIGASSNDPGDGDADVNGGGQEETSIGEPSCKAPIAKKRKRIIQDMELDRAQMPNENTKDEREAMKKTDQTNSTLASGKAAGKQPKDSSDAQKGDYIHVRARRGQATNSHSLAERVRREKISERMKFLQDLVPGCSKVTGKAVMLDEIINYVQSLQRQVEFLSMKLAAVNPRLDFNVEGILAKDLLQMRACSSSSIGFSQDMMHPQIHPSQHSLAHHAGISGLVNQPDATRRAVNAQFVPMNGFKEPTQHQMPNQWDDEYQNMSQMQFGANPPPVNAQELNAKSRDGFPM